MFEPWKILQRMNFIVSWTTFTFISLWQSQPSIQILPGVLDGADSIPSNKAMQCRTATYSLSNVKRKSCSCTYQYPPVQCTPNIPTHCNIIVTVPRRVVLQSSSNITLGVRRNYTRVAIMLVSSN